MNKKIVYIFIAIAFVINIVGIFVLPQSLVMQFNMSGEGSWSINKYLGLAIFLGLDLLGAFIALTRKEDVAKSYLILAIFLIVNVLMFVFNL